MARDPSEMMEDLHRAVVLLLREASTAIAVLADGLNPDKIQDPTLQDVEKTGEQFDEHAERFFQLLTLIRQQLRTSFTHLTSMAIPPDLSLPYRANLYAQEARWENDARRWAYVRRGVRDVVELLEAAKTAGIFGETGLREAGMGAVGIGVGSGSSGMVMGKRKGQEEGEAEEEEMEDV
ncbi:hypothetical protein HDU93_005189 [Gonapodya sp. JEL0774]|nr:hypothetical protein HDU93_005189 [Gonapodya sp. JEL0774]